MVCSIAVARRSNERRRVSVEISLIWSAPRESRGPVMSTDQSPLRKPFDRNIQVISDLTNILSEVHAQSPASATQGGNAQSEFAGNPILKDLRRSLEPEPNFRKPRNPVRKRSWALPELSVVARRALKSLAAVVILAALFVNPSLRLMTSTSAEAVINARVITLRAPIDGEVATQDEKIDVGTVYQSGAPVLRIVNARADRSRVDDLRRSISALEIESGSLAARLTYLKTRRKELADETALFQKVRAMLLEENAAEIDSQIAAAEAKQKEIDQTLSRSLSLKVAGFESAASLGRATRDSQVNLNEMASMKHRLEAAQVEIDATQRGMSVTDGYNDRPRAAELADAIDNQINELEAQLAEHKQRILDLSNAVADETVRFDAQAKAVLSAPVTGGLWEILTAPGEVVHRGQDLVKLLDCAGSVVTAAVSESTYNELKIGDPASFKLRGEQTEHAGKIIGLTGLAAAPSNFAILPASLEREPYRATIVVPDLTATSGCLVGRTGMITFKGQEGGLLRSAVNLLERLVL